VIGVIGRREQLLRALRRVDWASMGELQAAIIGSSGRYKHHSLWDAMQKLIAEGHVERDRSELSRYRITQSGLTEYARIKAARELEQLSL